MIKLIILGDVLKIYKYHPSRLQDKNIYIYPHL